MMIVFLVKICLMSKIFWKREEKMEKEIPGSEISYFFRKRSIALCFEIPLMNEKIAKDLLLKIDSLMDEQFLKKEKGCEN